MASFSLPEEPGRHRTWLPVDDSVRLPVLAVRGGRPGPIFVTSAGVHGDEYEGVRAIYEVFESLDSAELSGLWLALPVLNPNAHRACRRENPADGGNLARVFPGRRDGTETERIAWHFANRLLRHADLYLDLHSGGVRYAMPPMVGYHALDDRARRAAEAFGAPVLWAHPMIEPGRTVSFAAENNVPFLYTEARGAGRIDASDLTMMKRGITNLMRHLGMLAGEPEIPVKPRRMAGAGNTDDGIAAQAAGFWMPEVSLLDTVVAGQTLGRVVDMQGVLLQTVAASSAGTIGLLREMPAVESGDTLVLIADEEYRG